MNKHACIPRTQYCFSINGPSKELALYEQGDLYFSLYNFGVQIYPFKLERLKKSSKGKKDTAKRVHKARYLVMKIMTLKKRLEERFESIKLLDFPHIINQIVSYVRDFLPFKFFVKFLF